MILKFTTSQTGKQIITTDILPNISTSKNDQTLFLPLIEYNVRNIFFKNHAENEAVKLASDLHLFFENGLYGLKVNVQHLSFNMLW